MVFNIEVEVERRRGCGLPSEAMIATGLYAGDRVRIEARRGRITIVRVGEARVSAFKRAAAVKRRAEKDRGAEAPPTDEPTESTDQPIDADEPVADEPVGDEPVADDSAASAEE